MLIYFACLLNSKLITEINKEEKNEECFTKQNIYLLSPYWLFVCELAWDNEMSAWEAQETKGVDLSFLWEFDGDVKKQYVDRVKNLKLRLAQRASPREGVHYVKHSTFRYAEVQKAIWEAREEFNYRIFF